MKWGSIWGPVYGNTHIPEFYPSGLEYSAYRNAYKSLRLGLFVFSSLV